MKQTALFKVLVCAVKQNYLNNRTKEEKNKMCHSNNCFNGIFNFKIDTIPHFNQMKTMCKGLRFVSNQFDPHMGCNRLNAFDGNNENRLKLFVVFIVTNDSNIQL